MDDKEIARRSLDVQKRGVDVRLVDIPGYMEWSKRKLREGGNEAFIAHLDATSMWLLPEQMGTLSESDFDEMLDEVRRDCE